MPNKYTDVYCKYKVYLDEKVRTSGYEDAVFDFIIQDSGTEKISLTANPDFNHKKQFDFNPATRQLIDYLNNGSVMVQIMGKQYIRKSAVAAKKGLSTKEMLKSDRSVISK